MNLRLSLWLLGILLQFCTLLRAQSQEVLRCNPGPWGKLEYQYIYLESPESHSSLVPIPSQKTTWYIPGKNAEELESFLIEAGLPQVQVDDLLAKGMKGPPFVLFPSTELIFQLPPTLKANIYAELRKWSENLYFRQPIIIESGNVQEWFNGSGLSANTIEKIAALTYPLGQTLAFSDVSAVLSFIQSDDEERRFLRSLTRTRSLIVRLLLEDGTDFESLRDYWSAGYKNKSILPIFESLAEQEEIDSIDITHLLPPTPRKHLYTYPTLVNGLNGKFPDCYWISLNFFRYRPREELLDPLYIREYVKINYTLASPPSRFGDIVIFQNPSNGAPLHTAVYIADDIVYTKNSASLHSPFMLMRLPDLRARLNLSETLNIELWKINRR